MSDFNNNSSRKRDLAFSTAFDQTRLQKLGATIIIQEPSRNLVAFRTFLLHPANKDIADVASSRTSMSGVLHTVAALLDHEIHSAATHDDVERIFGELAEKLKARTSISINTRADAEEPTSPLPSTTHTLTH